MISIYTCFKNLTIIKGEFSEFDDDFILRIKFFAFGFFHVPNQHSEVIFVPYNEIVQIFFKFRLYFADLSRLEVLTGALQQATAEKKPWLCLGEMEITKKNWRMEGEVVGVRCKFVPRCA